MNVAFIIVAGLVAAFTLAVAVCTWSFPAARAVMRKRPLLTRRGLIFQMVLMLAFWTWQFYEEPRLWWLFVPLAVRTLGLAAMSWPRASYPNSPSAC